MTRRTRTVLVQTALSLLLKMGSVAASFAAVALALRQLDASTMGVWLVLLSVFQWITLFDLGIGPGARNEIGRAAASGDVDWMRRAVTTGWFYAITTSATLAFTLCAALLLTPA